MAFTLPSAQYLMTSNASTNRGTENGPTTGLKTAGNLPITTNGTQMINSQASSLTGTPERIYFGLTSQSSTGGFDMSSDSRVILTSVQYNAPNRIQSSTVANEGASFTVVSGTTETNFKRWFIGGNDTPFCSSQAGPVTMCIDPTAGNTDAVGDTFDDTNVSGWGWGCVRFNLQGTSTLQCFFQRVFMFQTVKNSTNIPKFTGTGNDWDDAFTAVQGSSYTTKIGAWLTKSGNSFFVPCPFQFGDGSATSVFDDGGAVVSSPADNAPNAENFRLTNQSMRVYRTANSTVTLSGTYSWGTASPWDFTDGSAALSGTFIGMGDLTLGASASLTGTASLASGSEVIVAALGASVDGSIINGDMELGVVQDMSNVTINGNLNITTAGTYNFDNVQVSGTITADAAVTINSTGGSTLPTSDGDVTVVSNTLVTLTGLQSGTEVRYYQAGTTTPELAGVESSGTTFAASVQVSSIDIVIHALGYLNIKLTSIDTSSGDVSLPVQQALDRQYENP